MASAAEHIRVPGWARTVLGVLILVTILGFFAGRAGQTLDTVRQAWQPVSWLYLALSFVTLLICLLILALAWYGLLRTLGGRLPLPVALRFYGLTLLPRYVPGMVWGYAGRTLLCEREGVPRKVAAGSAVVEVGLIVGTGVIVAATNYLSHGWIVLLTSLPGLILLFGFLLAWATHQRRWATRLTRAATWYGWGLVYIGFWLLYGASSWLVVLSVAPGIRLSSAPDVVVSATVAWLAGFLVVLVPGGLGVREGVFVLTLTPIIGPAGGTFVPLIARLIGMASEAVFSVLCVLLLRDNRRAPAEHHGDKV